MKDVKGKLQYKDKTYDVVFNLNVLEQIQEEYGTLDNWADLTDGEEVVFDEDGNPVIDQDGKQVTKPKEVDAKALKFGIWCMINEGIEIKNDEEGTDEPLVTKNQVGRMLTTYGVEEATQLVNQAVIDSTDIDEEKNV